MNLLLIRTSRRVSDDSHIFNINIISDESGQNISVLLDLEILFQTEQTQISFRKSRRANAVN